MSNAIFVKMFFPDEIQNRPVTGNKTVRRLRFINDKGTIEIYVNKNDLKNLEQLSKGETEGE